MGGVSADGSTLWLSGRYNAEVYAINTRTGRLRARIRVGAGPTACACGPSPGDIRSAIRGSCAEPAGWRWGGVGAGDREDALGRP